MDKSTRKTVLITGCSEGGIGSALAKEFASQDYHVYATARNTHKMSHFKGITGIEAIQLDPTSPESVDAARKLVEAKTGGRLDVLVNNAGQAYSCPILDTDIDKAKEVYDINVWGALRVTQAFSGMIIAAKGTIVFNSSIASVGRFPWLAMYASSKAALNTISETLRSEMAPFGVKVVTLMTGSVESNISKQPSVTGFQLPEDSFYRPIAADIANRIQNSDIGGAKTAEYARSVVTKLVGGFNGMLWSGKFSTAVWFMSSFLPRWMFDRAAVSSSGLQKLKSR